MAWCRMDFCHLGPFTWRLFNNKSCLASSTQINSYCFQPLSSIFWKTLTFIAVVIAWVVFRSENLSSALHIIHGMFTLDMRTDNNFMDFIPLSIGLLLVWYAPNSNEIFSINNKHSTISYKWSLNISSAILFSVMGFITVIYLARAQEFLYFQF